MPSCRCGPPRLLGAACDKARGKRGCTQMAADERGWDWGFRSGAARRASTDMESLVPQADPGPFACICGDLRACASALSCGIAMAAGPARPAWVGSSLTAARCAGPPGCPMASQVMARELHVAWALPCCCVAAARARCLLSGARGSPERRADAQAARGTGRPGPHRDRPRRLRAIAAPSQSAPRCHLPGPGFAWPASSRVRQRRRAEGPPLRSALA